MSVRSLSYRKTIRRQIDRTGDGKADSFCHSPAPNEWHLRHKTAEVSVPIQLVGDSGPDPSYFFFDDMRRMRLQRIN